MPDPLLVYIDDEPQLCRLFELHMQAQGGWRVVTFTDASAALDYLAQHQVGAVICDYRMPEMTGVELLAQLRGQLPPFLLVTGDHALEDADLDERVTEVLRKPFLYEALAARVRELLADRDA